MTSGFRLPKTNAFDLSLHFLLTRKQTNEVKSQPERFKILTRTKPFDYLDDREFYPMNFRVVRFEISKGVYECVITNLPRGVFPPSEIRKLYNMRWGIETSFRELKYAIGLNCFHAKKPAFVLQEIFARYARTRAGCHGLQSYENTELQGLSPLCSSVFAFGAI